MICKKAAIASLLLLFLVTGCTTNKLSENPPNTTTPSGNEKNKEEVKAPYIRRKPPFDEEVKVPVNEAQGLTSIEIVKKLWSIYLDCYKKAPITDSQKLKDYKIAQVREVKDTVDHEIVFGISFSVLPYQKDGYAWIIGGNTYKDCWIAKGMYVRLVKEGDLFKMEILGTGY